MFVHISVTTGAADLFFAVGSRLVDVEPGRHSNSSSKSQEEGPFRITHSRNVRPGTTMVNP